MATVENTNATILKMLEKADQRAEKAKKRAEEDRKRVEEDRRERAKDKEDIHRWFSGRSSVPNEILDLPPAVSPNATTTLQLSGSTRKSYLRRIFGGFSDDSKQQQDI